MNQKPYFQPAASPSKLANNRKPRHHLLTMAATKKMNSSTSSSCGTVLKQVDSPRQTPLQKPLNFRFSSLKRVMPCSRCFSLVAWYVVRSFKEAAYTWWVISSTSRRITIITRVARWHSNRCLSTRSKWQLFTIESSYSSVSSHLQALLRVTCRIKINQLWRPSHPSPSLRNFLIIHPTWRPTLKPASSPKVIGLASTQLLLWTQVSPSNNLCHWSPTSELLTEPCTRSLRFPAWALTSANWALRILNRTVMKKMKRNRKISRLHLLTITVERRQELSKLSQRNQWWEWAWIWPM